MNKNEDLENKLINLTRAYIAGMVELFVGTEKIISIVLEGYFAPVNATNLKKEELKKVLEFRNLILSKLSFEGKKNILLGLDFEKKLNVKFKGNIKKDLEFVQKIRNKIIHHRPKRDKKSGSFSYEFTENGREKKIILDEKLSNKLTKTYERITNNLESVLARLFPHLIKKGDFSVEKN